MPAFDPKSTKLEKALAHNAPLLTCRFSPSGDQVFATSEDRQILRWDWRKAVKTAFAGHDSWAFDLTFVDGGKQVVTAGGDGALIWHDAIAAKPTVVRKLAAHDGWVRCVETSPDGRVVASGGNDFLIKLWTDDGKPLRTLKGHQTRVYSLLFHPNGETLISGDLHGHVKFWNWKTGAELGDVHAKDLHTYEGGQMVDYGGVRGLTLSPDRKQVVACGLYKATNPLGNVSEPLVMLIDAEKRTLGKKLVADGLNGIGWRVKCLADGTIVVATGGTAGGFLTFWNPAQDKDVHRFQTPNIIRSVDLHPKENLFAAAHHDGNVRIYSIQGKK